MSASLLEDWTSPDAVDVHWGISSSPKTCFVLLLVLKPLNVLGNAVLIAVVISVLLRCFEEN